MKDEAAKELAQQLGEGRTASGAALSPEALCQIADGVNASPLGDADESWLTLVGGPPDPALRAALIAFRLARREQAAAGASGISSGGGKAAPGARLQALREALRAAGLDGFILPRADEHQGEALARRAERLAWLTGFTGSAGVAVILQDRAAVFTDGRYTVQIRHEIDPALYEACHITDDPPAGWIERALPPGGKLGYDPWLHTVDGLARLESMVDAAGGVMVPLTANPVDAIWGDQPPPPITPTVPHEARFAGRMVADKRLAIGADLTAAGQDAVVLSSPESIAWLLNIRGSDVPRTPLAQSFAMLTGEGAVTLFIDERKLTPETRKHLGNAVSVRPLDGFGPALDEAAKSERVVRIDPASSPVWIARRLEQAGGTVARGPDPTILPRACKNAVELSGTRSAHQRDGVAVARFLHWFASEAPGGGVDELGAAARLQAFRAEGAHFKDLSFDTISGAGPNGAIVHYRATRESNRRIGPGELYLVDSGAQYLDGTTDITRTLAIGDPGDEARDRYTRVLKAHIAVATALFPVGATGAQIDPLARAPLWQAGLDFDHGTGHGVGSYLSVHEGPQRISKAAHATPLEPGMILSNEPGYYKEGAYGIRLENLMIVEAREVPGGERAMLGFETITLAPFERAMIDPALLTVAELDWLNAYHRHVRDVLTDQLDPERDGEVAAWLKDATRAIEAVRR